MLFLPLAQTNLHLFFDKELVGHFNKSEDVDLSKIGWISTDFQKKKEKHISEYKNLFNTSYVMRFVIIFN